MKIKNTPILSAIILLIFLASAGIILSVYALLLQKQVITVAFAKSRTAISAIGPLKADQDYLTAFFYPQTTHVEPLLLLMLGTGLLSIVTGIKMIRSRRLRLPLKSTTPATTADLPLGLSKDKPTSLPEIT
jgi:hypothetical protein